MARKPSKINLILFIYWFLLIYIIAALVWWYIALYRQNAQMADYKIHLLKKENSQYPLLYDEIKDEKRRKINQYTGEGAIFFLLIGAGAIFLFRAVNKQLKLSQQQQNFMMAITHELKTPIAITKLNLETLQKRKLEGEQQQRLLYNTIQETNRMNSLCSNLLLSSQMEGGGYKITKENLHLSELLQNALTDFITRYPNRKFENEIHENAYTNGDIFLLQMAFNNLLENAVKYTPKESKIKISLIQKEGKNKVSFYDEGPGIDDREKKKVFEKFYRVGSETTKKAKGTGLGLFLTDKIVRAHEGNIFIENNQPNGSIFVIELKQPI
jgi:hypothetical protein